MRIAVNSFHSVQEIQSFSIAFELSLSRSLSISLTHAWELVSHLPQCFASLFATTMHCERRFFGKSLIDSAFFVFVVVCDLADAFISIKREKEEKKLSSEQSEVRSFINISFMWWHNAHGYNSHTNFRVQRKCGQYSHWK